MVKTWSLALFMTFCCSLLEAKKPLPVEKESQPSETEIICFAAMEKWVCAPSSDQQVAKDKAMRLIDEKSQNEAVVIKTLKEEKQWQNVVIETPAEPQKGNMTANQTFNIAEPEAGEVNKSVSQPARDQERSLASSKPQTETPSQTSAQTQNFTDWQRDYPQQWTLQAVGTTNLPNLEFFINQHQLGDQNMSVATTEVKGAPWHIVLVGLFESRDQALLYKAQAENSGADWASQAWPRPIAGIALID